MAIPLNLIVAGPLNRGQPNPSSPTHQIQSRTIRPFLANLPHRSQSNPPWPTHPILSWLTCPIVSTCHIVSNRLDPINDSHSIVPNLPHRGRAALSWPPSPLQSWRTHPLRPIHPMLSKPRHPICQPAPSWLTRPIAANPRQCNREHASSSQRHASRAKPGQSQAKLRPSQSLPRQARLI